MLSAKELSTAYFDWATKSIQLIEKESFVQVKTPFVDMYHDRIELVVEKKREHFIVSDDGYTLDELDTLDLHLSGSKVTKKRASLFNKILLTFGVTLSQDNELVVSFNKLEDFPEAQHRLVQAMLQVFDMLQTSRDKVFNFFVEDISEYFLDNEIQFSTRANYIGKTGSSTQFDFLIGQTRKRKERALKAINSPKPSSYEGPLMGIIDVRETRPETDFYIIANDSSITLSDRFINAFKNYNVPVLRWTERNKWLKEFA